LSDGGCNEIHDKRQDRRNPSENDRRDPPAPSATRSNSQDALNNRPSTKTRAEQQLNDEQKTHDDVLGISGVCPGGEAFGESGSRLYDVGDQRARDCRNNRGHQKDHQTGNESHDTQRLR
jgi:hypothetical protein